MTPHPTITLYEAAMHEDFETWCITKGINTQKYSDGGYVFSAARGDWEVWKSAVQLDRERRAEPGDGAGLEPWEHIVSEVVATMVFPSHSPDKPFIALGDCANLYPDAAQTKPLYTTPQPAKESVGGQDQWPSIPQMALLKLERLRHLTPPDIGSTWEDQYTEIVELLESEVATPTKDVPVDAGGVDAGLVKALDTLLTASKALVSQLSDQGMDDDVSEAIRALDHLATHDSIVSRALASAKAQQAAPRTALEQYDLDQSADYRKGYEDGRLKGFEVGQRYAVEAQQAVRVPEGGAK